MTTFIDTLQDRHGNTWQVNDRALYRIPGVRTDACRIMQLIPFTSDPVHIAAIRVEFDDLGGFPTVEPESLELIRRRTADEKPIID